MFQPPGRQANLPTPTPAAGAGNRMPGFHTGRVTYVDYDAETVDVYLEDGTLLQGIEVMGRSAGPDREDKDLPHPRSVVAVMYAEGSKFAPCVIGVLKRRTKRKKGQGATERGVYRRVFPSGTHLAIYDSGEFEVRTADGTTFTLNADGEAKEDHTGQPREGWDGDPFQDPPAIEQSRPAQYHLKVAMPDGSTLHMHDGRLEVTLPEGVTVKAPDVTVEATNATVTATGKAFVKGGQVDVEASGPATLKGAVVKVQGASMCEVDALLIRFNGGMLPVARITDVAIPAGIGNPTVLA